jgi:hypothetical protein
VDDDEEKEEEEEEEEADAEAKVGTVKEDGSMEEDCSAESRLDAVVSRRAAVLTWSTSCRWWPSFLARALSFS